MIKKRLARWVFGSTFLVALLVPAMAFAEEAAAANRLKRGRSVAAKALAAGLAMGLSALGARATHRPRSALPVPARSPSVPRCRSGSSRSRRSRKSSSFSASSRPSSSAASRTTTPVARWPGRRGREPKQWHWKTSSERSRSRRRRTPKRCLSRLARTRTRSSMKRSSEAARTRDVRVADAERAATLTQRTGPQRAKLEARKKLAAVKDVRCRRRVR